MTSKKYLAAVMALPLLGGTAAAAASMGSPAPVATASNGGELTLPAVPSAAESSDEQEGPRWSAAQARQAFWDAGYSYAQLAYLADYWEMDTDKAKIKAGRKLLNDKEHALRGPLANPHRFDARRAYWNAGYNGDQLDVLAEFWDVSVVKAKTKAGLFVLEGQRPVVDEILYQLAPYAAFWDAGYTGAQLDALAGFWGVDQLDAKAKAGGYVLYGDRSVVDEVLASLAGDNPSEETPTEGPTADEIAAYEAYWNAGYTFNQLRYLADLWDVEQLDAKAKAGAYILNGEAGIVDGALEGFNGPRYSTEEAYAAFWDAGYRYEELRYLAEYWDLGEFKAKAKAGKKVLNDKRGEVDAILADADIPAPAPAPDPGVWEPTESDIAAFEAYWDAGYTYEQLVALADIWGLSEFDAKVKAGTYVLNGNTTPIDNAIASLAAG
ncbi:MAG: hypothetical protein AAGD35_10420 [Actinomycetota bacterium]